MRRSIKKPAEPKEYTEFEIKLSQRILCSTLSVEMGISYQHCWKTYVEPQLAKDGTVGELYLEVARYIHLNLREEQKAIFSGLVS